MKKTQFYGIIAVAVMIGFTFAACRGPMGPQGPQGPQGQPGALGRDGGTVTICRETGNWFINGENTGIPAQGTDGASGTIIEIRYGYWYIDGEPTGKAIQGSAGASGTIIEIRYGYWYIDGEPTGKAVQGPAGTPGSVVEIRYGYWYIDDKPTGIPVQGPQGNDGCGCDLGDLGCGCTHGDVGCGCDLGDLGCGCMHGDVGCGCTHGDVGCGCTHGDVGCGCTHGGLGCGCSAPAASVIIVGSGGTSISSLSLAGGQFYTLSVKDQDGEPITNVLWDSDNPNAVSVHRNTRFAVATGYSVQIRAVDTMAGSTATITATSLEGGNMLIEAYVVVTISTVTGVEVLPSTVVVERGTTQNFTATVAGSHSPPQDVIWSVVETGRHAQTAIDAGGVLTVAAAETLSILTVRATSKFASGIYGTAIVVVVPPAFPLTENVWASGTITAAGGEFWFSFNAVAGTAYHLWWNDSFQGDGTKTMDTAVCAFGPDGTSIFTRLDTHWSNPRGITPAQSGTVRIRFTGWNFGNTGTFGIVYSTTPSPRPPVPVLPSQVSIGIRFTDLVDRADGILNIGNLSLLGLSGTPAVITLENPGGYTFNNIKWLFDDHDIGDGTGTLILGTHVNGQMLRIGEHFLTVVVEIDGRAYSNRIAFRVTP